MLRRRGLSLAPVCSSSSSSRTTSLRRRCRCLVSMTNCSALVLCLHHCMVPAHFCSFAQLSHCCISLPFVPLLVDLCASLFVPPNRGPKYICLRFGLPWRPHCAGTVHGCRFDDNPSFCPYVEGVAKNVAIAAAGTGVIILGRMLPHSWLAPNPRTNHGHRPRRSR